MEILQKILDAEIASSRPTYWVGLASIQEISARPNIINDNAISLLLEHHAYARSDNIIASLEEIVASQWHSACNVLNQYFNSGKLLISQVLNLELGIMGGAVF